MPCLNLLVGNWNYQTKADNDVEDNALCTTGVSITTQGGNMLYKYSKGKETYNMV